ncbi:MAG: sulfite exporter TauE/SafE family protein [Flavobacteriales bacterium]|nr:sulfite exporter TauE/SafE family protein [Flavobacteriia bacterium]NCP04753.1 sulfite exporter TauE/SafE family protein [Flavobacteriales bacterium]PIV92643.1 MAG: integrase [Flavobacteriaceae bacterium CG17_big_fil_post_rev_8_21_14_2_50_33_15]PIY11105.1 MAG: integrase [Flavobacteriaceae bacterium CG_4_10_14_3_um_filter_33_47]PJB17790.1 MAG: integrase [Flavobacteriaceae bacterium CG_4_9_14_3_um_filter_33_16]
MEHWYYYVLLVVVGIIVGIINTMSGGGSLLTLPILIFVGLPSNVANGTNRIAIFVQSIFNIAGYHSKHAIDKSPFPFYISISATIGAIIGAKLAIDIKGELFNKILAVVMVAMVCFMILRPKQNFNEIANRIKGKYLIYSIMIFFFIGIYGGFIQAGTGIFILLALSSINHLTLIKSNIIKVIVMFIYTTAALLMFGINLKLDWVAGLTLASGQAAGGWFTSRWSVNKGDGVVKIFLIIMVSGMAIKLWFF